MGQTGTNTVTTEGGLRPVSVLVAALVGVFVTAFPAVILVASLPELAANLNTTETTVAWVITAPILVSSVSLPMFGRLGDTYGHKRIFLLGLAISAVASLLCALAWNVHSLIVLRSIAQAAGSATHPAAIAMLMATYRGEARAKSLGFWAFVGAGSPSLGLALGGPLIGATSWRAIFVVQTVAALVGLVIAYRWLTETARRRVASLDMAGGLTLMVAVGSFLLVLDRGAARGWTNDSVLVFTLTCLVAAGAFVYVERRSRAPMLPLDLLARQSFSLPIAAEALSQASTMGVFFIVPFILHGEFEQNAAGTALLMLPLPLGMAAASPLGGRLTWRWGSRATAMAGTMSLMAATVGIMVAQAQHSLPMFLMALVVLGAGNGFLRPAIASALAKALDDTSMGVGMATLRMLSQVGTTIGITIAVAATAPDGTGWALWSALAIGLLALLAASTLARGQKVESGRVQPAVPSLAKVEP
ncbi:MAG: MFS transporter [Aquihabitans sp.]